MQQHSMVSYLPCRFGTVSGLCSNSIECAQHMLCAFQVRFGLLTGSWLCWPALVHNERHGSPDQRTGASAGSMGLVDPGTEPAGFESAGPWLKQNVADASARACEDM